MKKIVVMIITLLMIGSMAVTAYAVTPTLSIPKMPRIPGIRFNVDVKVSQTCLDRWFEEYPVSIACHR